MKTLALLSFVSAVGCLCLPCHALTVAAHEDKTAVYDYSAFYDGIVGRTSIPSADDVVTYERYNKRELTWFPVSKTDGDTLLASLRGMDSNRYYNRLKIPDAERKVISHLFDTWTEADRKRIASQPLPCQYRVGSVEGGSTLSGIARLFYGDARQWPKIYEANKAIIKNPDIIEQGMRITIPKLEP